MVSENGMGVPAIATDGTGGKVGVGGCQSEEI